MCSQALDLLSLKITSVLRSHYVDPRQRFRGLGFRQHVRLLCRLLSEVRGYSILRDFLVIIVIRRRLSVIHF